MQSGVKLELMDFGLTSQVVNWMYFGEVLLTVKLELMLL